MGYGIWVVVVWFPFYFVCNKLATNHLEMRWVPPQLGAQIHSNKFRWHGENDSEVRAGSCALFTGCWWGHTLNQPNAVLPQVPDCVTSSSPPHLEHRSIQTSFAGMVKMVLKCVPDHIYKRIYTYDITEYWFGIFHCNDIPTDVHTYITRMPACIHMYMRTQSNKHTCIRMYRHTGIHAHRYYMHTCNTHTHICTHTYTHTQAYTHIDTQFFFHLHTYLPTYVPMYLHTYIERDIYIYIDT